MNKKILHQYTFIMTVAAIIIVITFALQPRASVSAPTLSFQATLDDVAGRLDLAQTVVTQGNYAYVLAGTGAAGSATDVLTIVDISDPANPSVTGSVSGIDVKDARSLVVDGDYAYVASGETTTLHIIDISDPTTPSLAASLVDAANFAEGYSIAKKGDYVYIGGAQSAASIGIIAAVDVSSPTRPSVVGAIEDLDLDTPFFTNRSLSGDYLFVGTGDDSNVITIIDLSTPDSPSIAGTAPLALAVNYPVVSGNYLYTALAESGLIVVFDISTPTSPTFISQSSLPYFYDASITNIGDMVANTEYLFLVDTDTDLLAVIDLSNPSELSVRSSTSYAGFNFPWALDFNDDNDTIIVASTLSSSIMTFDFSEPITTTEITTTTQRGSRGTLGPGRRMNAAILKLFNNNQD